MGQPHKGGCLMSQLHNWFSNALNTIGSWITYLWATVTAGTALLSLQDYTFIIGTVIGAIYTIRTYRINKAAQLAAMADKQRRTDLYAEWLKNYDPSKPPAALEIVNEALQRASNDA